MRILPPRRCTLCSRGSSQRGWPALAFALWLKRTAEGYWRKPNGGRSTAEADGGRSTAEAKAETIGGAACVISASVAIGVAGSSQLRSKLIAWGFIKKCICCHRVVGSSQLLSKLIAWICNQSCGPAAFGVAWFINQPLCGTAFEVCSLACKHSCCKIRARLIAL